MVFKGTRDNMNVFVASIPNELKKEKHANSKIVCALT